MNYIYTITDRAHEIHEWAVKQGFWNDPDPIPYKLALIHDEVSEITRAYRKEDKTGMGEECIDAVMRLLDLAEYLEVHPDGLWIKKMNLIRAKGDERKKRYKRDLTETMEPRIIGTVRDVFGKGGL